MLLVTKKLAPAICTEDNKEIPLMVTPENSQELPPCAQEKNVAVVAEENIQEILPCYPIESLHYPGVEDHQQNY